MRCGECEAAGLVEPCFCPCCGRPLTAVQPRPAIAAPVVDAPRYHPCASCGADAPDDRELCAPCEDAFQRVLAPAATGPTPGEVSAVREDDTPTIVSGPWVVHATEPGRSDSPTAAADSGPEPPLDAWFVPPSEPMPSPPGEPAPPADPGMPASEPKPWWEMPDQGIQAVAAPAPVLPATHAEAPDLTADVALPAEPSPVPSAPDPVAQPAPRAAEPAPAHASEVHVPAERLERPLRPPRPRTPPPRRRLARTRQSAGRLVGIAVATAAVCTLGLIGVPHLLDLTWRAPAAPAAQPVVPATPASPLPDTSSLVPATDPSAPAAPPEVPSTPAAEAPAPSAQKRAATRPASRPTGPGAASRAARLLQQKAAQSRPGSAGATPAAEEPRELPAPAVAVAPPVVAAPEPAPTRVDEPLGQAFEVTQVDVRPQVTRQVAPRRPDDRTTADVVVVRVLVSPAGRPADVRVVRSAKGSTAYDAAAIEAVKRWSFSPAQKRSRPVSCWVHVGVPFAEGGG